MAGDAPTAAAPSAITTEQDPTQKKELFSASNNEEHGTSTARNPKGPRIRAAENRWRQQLKIWWIPIAHLAVTAAIAACMVLLLDTYEALADGNDNFWDITKREQFRLRISEVTTLVSASMVIVKILVSSWAAVAVSGCVFILLEGPGLEISALENMMRLGLPAVWPKGGKGWAVATVLLLLFPQQFISPLVTGAVGWSTLAGHSENLSREVTSISRTNNIAIPRGTTNFTVCDLAPVSGLDDQRSAVSNSDMPPPGLNMHKRQNRQHCRVEHVTHFGGVSDSEWAELRDWTVFLDTVVNTKLAPRQAAGLSTALWPPNELQNGDRRTCRTQVAADQQSIPVGSSAYNVDLPCIVVGNITWTADPVQGVQDLTKNASHTALTEYPAEGASMLFNRTSGSITDLVPQGYSPDKVVQYPNASTFSGTLELLVQLYAFRKDIPANSTPSCTPNGLHNMTIFGSLQGVPDKAIFKSDFGCYAYAIVELTAGMVNFKQADFVHSDALEGVWGSPLTRADFKPDTWVRSSLLLSKDVMLDLSTSNTTKIPTWNNLDSYVETLIRQSYLGSWGVLRSLQGNPTIFKVYLAEPRLQAAVSKIRVLAWFIISLFVPVSALVWYFGAQWTTDRNLVLNYTIAALLTDVSPALNDPVAKDLHLTNLSYVTRKDKSLKLRLDTDGMGKHSLSVKKVERWTWWNRLISIFKHDE